MSGRPVKGQGGEGGGWSERHEPGGMDGLATHYRKLVVQTVCRELDKHAEGRAARGSPSQRIIRHEAQERGL